MSYERMAKRVSAMATGDGWCKHLRPSGKRIAHGVVRSMDLTLVRDGLSEYEADEAERWPPRDYNGRWWMDDYDPPESPHPPTAPHCETCCCDLRSTKRDP